MPTSRANPRPLLTCDGRYDRSAITSAAWAFARAALILPRPIRGYTPPPLPTLRQAFAAGMRRTWDLARGQRACHQHHVATMAEAARRSAMPAVQREVLNLRDARAIAPMTDSTRRMVADLVAIDARALALGVQL